jgi:hypothetical protein
MMIAMRDGSTHVLLGDAVRQHTWPSKFPRLKEEHWLEGRFALRGMFNIAMEAFEEFCRAKTNFYIFEKVGNGTDGPTQGEFENGEDS